MKILFVGDASNMHNCLAQQLRQMGHEAVVASGGSGWMNCNRDINLRRSGRRLGALAYVARVLAALPKMRGFDVVEISNPIFLQLKPQRVRRVFDYLRRHNGKIVLSALGTDLAYFNACHDGNTYRYSDYRIGDKPSPFVESTEYVAQHQDNWRLPMMKTHHDYILERVDGVIACLWEYYEAYRPLLPPEKLAYAGIPIDTESIRPHFIENEPEKVKFFIGLQRSRNVIKGTDRLLGAAKRVVAAMPERCSIDIVENLPYAQYVERMSDAHVLLDQLYSYTPATNALLAMSQGMVAVSGAEPEYYDLIGEHDNHPIINVCPEPDNIEQQLTLLVEHKAELPALSRASRAFVEKHNAASIVATRHLHFLGRI